MKEFCQINLSELKILLQKLTLAQYTVSLSLLSGSSISEHVRHILEFYECVLQDSSGTINYDDRQRDKRIETDIAYAIFCIDLLTAGLLMIENDRPLVLVGNYSVSDSDSNLLIHSTLYRELAYCLEHSIHHQALLKIGLTDLNLGNLIGIEFGVAPATIRYRTA